MMQMNSPSCTSKSTSAKGVTDFPRDVYETVRPLTESFGSFGGVCCAICGATDSLPGIIPLNLFVGTGERVISNDRCVEAQSRHEKRFVSK